MNGVQSVAGHTAGVAVADEKNASLTMKLVAKAGYRSEVKTPAISPNQWGAIMAICEGGDGCARMLASADLLAACKALLASHRPGVGQCCAASDMGIAAIAKATAARQSTTNDSGKGEGLDHG